MDPKGSGDLKLFSMRPGTLDPAAPWGAFKNLEIFQTAPPTPLQPSKSNVLGMRFERGKKKKDFIPLCDSSVQPRLRDTSRCILGAVSEQPLAAREHCGKSAAGRARET